MPKLKSYKRRMRDSLLSIKCKMFNAEFTSTNSFKIEVAQVLDEAFTN